MGSGNSLLFAPHTIVPVSSSNEGGDFKFPSHRSARVVEVSSTIRTREEDMSSMISLMKLVMENDQFRHMFYRFVDKKGKASIVQSFQTLEQLRKELTDTALYSSNTGRKIELLESGPNIPETYGLCSFVVLESAQLLKDIHRQYQDKKEVTPCYWLKRILSIQENILSLLLEEFDEFIVTDEFQNERHRIAPVQQTSRPSPTTSTNHQNSSNPFHLPTIASSHELHLHASSSTHSL
jgi:hypothetical protein